MPEIKERPIGIETTQQPVESVRSTPELTDLKKEAPIPREVKTWMEKLEEDPVLRQNTQNSQTNDDSALKPISSTPTKITLPTDRTSFTGGFSKPVNSAWRWLSEFVLRIIKKNQGNVKFKEE
jgi:hypothetical protein